MRPARASHTVTGESPRAETQLRVSAHLRARAASRHLESPCFAHHAREYYLAPRPGCSSALACVHERGRDMHRPVPRWPCLGVPPRAEGQRRVSASMRDRAGPPRADSPCLIDRVLEYQHTPKLHCVSACSCEHGRSRDNRKARAIRQRRWRLGEVTALSPQATVTLHLSRGELLLRAARPRKWRLGEVTARSPRAVVTLHNHGRELLLRAVRQSKW